IDPNGIFFVMEPWKWGSSLAHWETSPGGYLPRPNVVYEFHIYYEHWATRSGTGPTEWAVAYNSGQNALGDTKMRNWHNTYVTMVQDAGYPVFNGEFGLTDGSSSKAPLQRICHLGQLLLLRLYNQ
ncbi:unnamed protein product, partial [marine sediment metagenome]